MERSTMLFMGKSTISTGPFSIANCYIVYQAGYGKKYGDLISGNPKSWIRNQSLAVSSRHFPHQGAASSEIRRTSSWGGHQQKNWVVLEIKKKVTS